MQQLTIGTLLRGGSYKIEKVPGQGSIGFYWSSTPQTQYEDNSYELELTDNQINVSWWYNSTPRSVRLVKTK